MRLVHSLRVQGLLVQAIYVARLVRETGGPLRPSLKCPVPALFPSTKVLVIGRFGQRPEPVDEDHGSPHPKSSFVHTPQNTVRDSGSRPEIGASTSPSLFPPWRPSRPRAYCVSCGQSSASSQSKFESAMRNTTRCLQRTSDSCTR